MQPATDLMTSGAERREHERFDIRIPVHLEGVGNARSENISAGGACISCEGEAPAIGERVQMAVDLPSGPVQVDAEVRWASKCKRKVGLQFRGGQKAAIAAFITAFVGATQIASAAASLTVPEFDPQGDVQLDMERGGERPDEYNVMQAFEQQYDSFDQCVAEAKGKSHKQWPGDVHVEVLLNPDGHIPLGVNAQVPGSAAKKRGLRECLRSAVASAEYPSYDGPPVVVEFDFELDPGTEWVEE